MLFFVCAKIFAAYAATSIRFEHVAPRDSQGVNKVLSQRIRLLQVRLYSQIDYAHSFHSDIAARFHSFHYHYVLHIICSLEVVHKVDFKMCWILAVTLLVVVVKVKFFVYLIHSLTFKTIMQTMMLVLLPHV